MCIIYVKGNSNRFVLMKVIIFIVFYLYNYKFIINVIKPTSLIYKEVNEKSKNSETIRIACFISCQSLFLIMCC